MLCQSFQSIPKEKRKLITNCIMFKPSKVEFEKLFEELFESKKEYVLDLLNLYKKRGDYLFLNVEFQKIYANFDEIVLDDSDDEN